MGYNVNDSLRFLFSYCFFSWFFFSQNFVHAISQILLAHYILSHFAQMIGRDQNFLDVICCHFQYRFISLIFEIFYDPLCAAVNWKTIIYELFFLGEVEDVHHVVIWRKLRNLLTSLWLENWVWTLSQNLHTFSSVSFYQLIICQNIYNKDDEEIKVLSNKNKKRGMDHLIRGQVTCKLFYK